MEQLLHGSEDPFEVDERLAELAGELQAEYSDYDLTDAVVNAVEGASPPSEERVGELSKMPNGCLEVSMSSCGGFGKPWMSCRMALL
ncbi:hypothetical protein [Natronorubrum sp. FCH18a]|uniref:hypothetical protein n=1 Tax=Natronorubrum sp. FCH18a TaxID=3447018 RepID=UPI003F513EE3